MKGAAILTSLLSYYNNTSTHNDNFQILYINSLQSLKLHPLMKTLFFFLLLMLPAVVTYAEPWLSDPLLSESAIVTPTGHGWFKLKAQSAYNTAFYNINYDLQSLPQTIDEDLDFHLNYGITKNIEVRYLVPYIHNKTQGKQAGKLGDTSISISRQILHQYEDTWPPNIKLMLLQVIPTGHYDQLNPALYGTDATGQGSYLTTVALSMEHLNWLGGEHYFVQFATVSLTHPSRVNLQGHSIYGGGKETDGKIWPGNAIAFNLAGEYTFTQKLGLIVESYIYAQKASHFQGQLGPITPRFEHSGGRSSQHGRIRRADGRVESSLENIVVNQLRPSFLNLGSFQNIGHGNTAEFTLAPAVYYSFTKQITLTGGVWFTVAGKNTPFFYNPTLQFMSRF